MTMMSGAAADSEVEQMDRDIKRRMGEMSVDEKIAQLQGIWNDRRDMENEAGEFLPEKASETLSLGIGHIARPEENKEPLTENKSPAATIEFTNALQRWLLENSSTKIPAVFHGESLHGHMAEDATSFPQSLGLASTWNPELLGRTFSVVAKETRARGVSHALSPVLDVAKDPRWGRIEETYGEDPYLVSAIGMEVVRNLQGDGLMLARDKVLITLKHLAGHGYPMGGHNIAPAMMGERYLREQLLPPFEQVVRHFDVGSVMASYNEIDGVPSHANSWLLNDVLRGEWGFQGSVVSDYFAIDELHKRHGLVEDLDAAGVLAFQSGVDIELPNPTTYGALKAALESGKISTEQLDAAVYRALRDKYRLGLFEDPYTDPKGVSVIGSQEHKALAREVAEEAVVLLKNEGILPLDLKGVKKIALIGPHVDEVQLGGYSDIPSSGVTLAEGLAKALPDSISLMVEPGMRLTEDESPVNEKALRVKSYSKSRWNVDEIKLVSDEENAAAIERARAAAKSADLVILAVGDNEGTAREGWAENHLGDRSTLALAGSQIPLMEAVLAEGKPVVTVLLNGRPPEIGPWLPKFSALLEAWYPGEQGGAALADILLGKVNPSGRLPLSFPRNSGQIPNYYNVKPTANRGYAHEENGPLFSFGYGLSYTQFSYGDLSAEASKVGLDDDIVLSFNLKNTGKRDGQEVVQLYMRDPIASVTRPVKELKGFAKIPLKSGEQKRVKVRIPAKALYFWGRDMTRVVEAGEFVFMIGASSDDIRHEVKVRVTDSGKFRNTEHLPYFSRWEF